MELWTISCGEFGFAGFWSKTTAQNHQLNDCQWLVILATSSQAVLTFGNDSDDAECPDLCP